MIRTRTSVRLAFATSAAFALAMSVVIADDSERLLTVDHYVKVRSTVPAIAGEPAAIYARESPRGSGTAERRLDRSRDPLRPRCWHSGRSGVRCAVSGLQRDGLSRASGIRRLLHGHHRLRPFNASGTHE